MEAKKVALLKDKLSEESVGTAMLLDVVDFVDTISNRCDVRGSLLSDKEHRIMVMTTSYLLARKTTGYNNQ